jgi:hypothetical protein
VAGLVGWAGLASAAPPPSPSQLKAIGSPSAAAKTQPLAGLGATPITQPLIVVSFAGSRATILGGSAVSTTATQRARLASIPISAGSCSVNFTNVKTPATNRRSVTVRWFGGIACNRSSILFGRAFLAQSATNYAAYGNYYSVQRTSASSGNANTVVGGSNPSLYIWHATNIFFQEHPSRGVIAVVPSPGQQVNAATSCRVARSVKYGFGVHCDIYSQRF